LTNDHLGSPRITTDGNGKVVSRRDFLPFGEEISAGVGGRTAAQGYGPAMPRQKFSKKERDAETGLDYFLARYYSSTQGRFTSPDEYKNGPVEFNELEEEEAAELEREAQADPLYYAIQANPQSINKYVYCYDNPLRFIDPDGHQGVATFNARLIQLGDRLVKTPAGQRVTAEATAAAAVTYAIISGAAKRGVEWFGSGNTVGDSSCPGCTSSQRMGQSLMSNSNSSGQQGNNGQANGSGQGSSGTGSIKPPKPKLTAKERREQDRQRTADAKANPPPRSAKDYDPRGRGKIKTAEDATDQREGLEAASKKKSGIDSKKKTRDREIQKAKEENR
jgi:RHS repeat-associated protein